MGDCPPLGAHLSIAGGVWRAVERAVELECRALQIFTQAPGRWTGPPIPVRAAERFRQAAAAAGLASTSFAHAPYLINVAAPDDGIWERSIALLAEQLQRAEQLGLAGLVLHPGAHRGRGVEAGLERAAQGVARALEASPGVPPLLLEATAGQGTTLGSTLEEIGRLLELLPGDRVGVCWDTAHLWGAGYDLAGERGWQALWDEFTRWTGRSRPDLVHLNDTLVELGSRRDRHERIGCGVLGVGTFSRIVRDPRLAVTPMVLETPKGGEGGNWDRQALEFLRSLVEGDGAWSGQARPPC